MYFCLRGFKGIFVDDFLFIFYISVNYVNEENMNDYIIFFKVKFYKFFRL